MEEREGRRVRMKDVTGDEDDQYFGPGDKKETTRTRSRDDERYEVPRSRREETSRSRASEDDSPSEDDIRGKKEQYTDDDFKGEVIAKEDRPTIPEDVYEAVCVDVIPTMMADKFKGGQKVPKVKFVFEIIDDPDYKGYKISRILNKHFSEESNLVKFYSKITGTEVSKGTSIDIRKCKGKVCRISVEVKKSDDGKKSNKIEEVFSKKKRREVDE